MSTHGREESNGDPPDDQSDAPRESATGEETGDEKLGPPEYLGYRVLRERERQDEKPTSRSRFWKLCCITDRYLNKELGTDAGFPRHWYKYGEVGEPHSVNRGILNAPKARFWKGQEIHSDREIPETAFDITEAERNDIFEAARTTIQRHGKKSAEELKRHQYEKQSPNDFIEAYSRLRGHLEVLDLEESNQQQEVLQGFEEFEESNYLEIVLDEMLMHYPKEREDYDDVYRLYLRWDDTMRMLLEEEASAHDMKVFLEFFVEQLSEITLRFQHEQNIPDEKLAAWREERDDKIRKLNEGVEETREDCLSGHGYSGELASISEIFDQQVLERV